MLPADARRRKNARGEASGGGARVAHPSSLLLGRGRCCIHHLNASRWPEYALAAPARKPTLPLAAARHKHARAPACVLKAVARRQIQLAQVSVAACALHRHPCALGSLARHANEHAHRVGQVAIACRHAPLVAQHVRVHRHTQRALALGRRRALLLAERSARAQRGTRGRQAGSLRTSFCISDSGDLRKLANMLIVAASASKRSSVVAATRSDARSVKHSCDL